MLFLLAGCCLAEVLSTQGRGALAEGRAGRGARLGGSRQRGTSRQPGRASCLLRPRRPAEPPPSGTALLGLFCGLSTEFSSFLYQLREM